MISVQTRQRAVRAICLSVVAALAATFLPASAEAAGTPKVVLDPDHFSFAKAGTWGDPAVHESLPINYAIAQLVQTRLPDVCAADVVITRTPAQASMTLAQRAAQMQDADLGVTLSLDALNGLPWGTEAEGGSKAFTKPDAASLALGTALTSEISSATTRPVQAAVNQGPTNGTTYPYAEYAALPGTYAQIFMLYIDHNFDLQYVRDGQSILADAVVTALGHALQAKGFKCLGSFPARPSAEVQQRFRNLGYQSFLRYGADPISMSTGNFTTSEDTFSLSGVGNQLIDLTLNYNAQSGIDSPVGAGWQFGLGSYLVQFSDGSVGVSLADGRAFHFDVAGSGFNSPPGSFATLTQPDSSTFVWTSKTGEVLTFVQDASGRGALTSVKDRQGNSTTLTYGAVGAIFPRLQMITDQAGQTVSVATNSDGRITSFTRPDGAVWKLAYSGTGDLTSITSARNTTRQFTYDSSHRMLTEVGQDGVTFLTNTYDAESRVVKQTNALGDLRLIAYDDAAKKTSYTDATGALTVFHWNSLGQITQVDDALGGVSKTEYDAEFHPVKDIDPLGNVTTKSYDASGQLATVIDALGHATTRSYNAAGDPTAVADEGGIGGATRTFSFAVNAAGLPTTLTNPDGSTRTRTYNAFGDLLTETNELGNVTTYQYDARGNTTAVIDPLGRTTAMTYDLANRLTSSTDPLGRTTAFSYDANDNLLKTTFANGSAEIQTYNVNDVVSSKTDRRGATTSYVYDKQLNLAKITNADGGVTAFEYDEEDRLVKKTDPLGGVTAYTLDALGRRVSTTDALGRVTAAQFDAASRLTKEIDAAGKTTTYVRDANGRALTVTDPAGAVIASQFDAVGRVTQVTDPLGHATSAAYNFRDQVTKTTDPTGGIDSTVFDAMGRRTRHTDAVGAQTNFAYDKANQLTKQTDALGGVTSFGYDAAGNQTSVTDPNGHVTLRSFNVMNELVAQTDAKSHATQLSRDLGGLVTAITDPLGHQQTRTYDLMGRVLAEKDALARTRTLTWDLNGRNTKVVDPDGVATQNVFDAVGNLTAVVQNKVAGGAFNASTNVTTQYQYDARNLLTAIIDANGRTTSRSYDSRGLLASETDPLGHVTTNTYDADRNLKTTKDGNGAVKTLTYDARDLLLKRAYPDGTNDAFTYDAVGRQLTATNKIGTVATSFDALGRVTKVVDANNKTLKYAYDAAGNRTQVTLPDGRPVKYAYDPANLLTKQQSPVGDVTTAYDAANRPMTITRANGTITQITFDNADQLLGIATQKSGRLIGAFTYARNAMGNVTSRLQDFGRFQKTSMSYAYDPLRRLISSSGGPGHVSSSYTYDSVGNRLTWRSTDDPTTPILIDPFTETDTYNSANELVSSSKKKVLSSILGQGTTTYQYDNNGNRTLATQRNLRGLFVSRTAYQYDFNNRVVASGPGDRNGKVCGRPIRDLGCPADLLNDLLAPSVPYNALERRQVRNYDALGRVASETNARITTKWVQDGLDPIVSEDLTKTFFLRDGSGSLLGEESRKNGTWYLTDALGSIVGSTNTAGQLGRLIANYTDYGIQTSVNPFKFGFTGAQTDLRNGGPILQFFARTYDPVTSTWLQRDPFSGSLRKPETLSSSRYAENNPASRRDAFGFLSVDVAHPTERVVVVGSAGLGVDQASAGSTRALEPTASPQVTADASVLQPAADARYLFRDACRMSRVPAAKRATLVCAPPLRVSASGPATRLAVQDMGQPFAYSPIPGRTGVDRGVETIGLLNDTADALMYLRDAGQFLQNFGEGYLAVIAKGGTIPGAIRFGYTLQAVRGGIGWTGLAVAIAGVDVGVNAYQHGWADERTIKSEFVGGAGIAGSAIGGPIGGAAATVVAHGSWWAGDRIGQSEGYQSAVNDGLDCFPNCSAATPFTILGKGLWRWATPF